MSAPRLCRFIALPGIALIALASLTSCANGSASVSVNYGIYGGSGWYDPYYGRPGGWYPVGPPVRPPPVRPPPVVRPPPTQLPNRPRPTPY